MKKQKRQTKAELLKEFFELLDQTDLHIEGSYCILTVVKRTATGGLADDVAGAKKLLSILEELQYRTGSRDKE